jgi:hypothetical protein
MNTRRFIVWVISCLALLLGASGCATTSENSSRTIQQMSKEDLKSRLEDPSLVILDVRRPRDLKKSGKKIKGAVSDDFFSNAGFIEFKEKKGPLISI